MEELAGTVLAGRSFDPMRGRVVVDDGRIEAVEETATTSTDIVLPAFVNAHTHVGDSVAKEAAVGLGLEEAVVPPDSLKHRRLSAADRELVALADRFHAQLRGPVLIEGETGTGKELFARRVEITEHAAELARIMDLRARRAICPVRLTVACDKLD